jgi:hypothetical protein
MDIRGVKAALLWLAVSFGLSGGARAGGESDAAFARALNVDASVFMGSFRDFQLPGQPATRSPVPGPIPDPIYGVTIEDLHNVPAAVASLRAIVRKPTARLVFLPNTSAQAYQDVVDQVHGVSYILGQILDSFYMKGCSVSQYERRTEDYFTALGDKVDVWEIGNEVNGNWLGETSEVSAKIAAAYDVVKSRGGKTALTLHYSSDYADDPAHEPFHWAEVNVPPQMKKGLDYVLISYYEDDSPGPAPDWDSVFQRLALMFPNAKVGFGEVGTKKTAKKRGILRRAYSLHVNAPRYIGGYFWWYFSKDMVPADRQLLKDLNAIIKP